jgi:hypothetical protein
MFLHIDLFSILPVVIKNFWEFNSGNDVRKK